ncbi:MAG: CRTAC1 family protein [Gemmatimonadetes bacterium]|nr:CRTAC1 family protein [Gemmatimonadota bacterium]
MQVEVFATPGAQPNAWADYDNDGDLDLFVGFRGARNRLYRNDGGRFTDVAASVGLDDLPETRAAAWGDFDRDGQLDLYVGFAGRDSVANRLYRNEGNGTRFTDVGARYGVAVIGVTRQPSWVDYDNDGDVDLFVAFRDQPNRLFRNDGTRFTDVTAQSGIGDPRRTVGVAWFDMDTDGDLDAFVANQDGDEDGVFRNDGGRFTDVARALGMHQPGRASDHGSVGPAVTDYDNDGDLDIFIATYGPDVLWQNQGAGTFREVARGTPLSGDYHSTTAAFGDYDNDGWEDVFVASYLADQAEAPDHLFRNERGVFSDLTPKAMLEKGASHGVTWADYDGDGDLDLALANNHARGTHVLYRNDLPPAAASRSLFVQVLDADGRYTRAGSEVRLFDAVSGRLLGARLVDSGGGYCSHGTAPVHFGLQSGVERVHVRATVMTPAGRRDIEMRDVAPDRLLRRTLDVRAPR